MTRVESPEFQSFHENTMNQYGFMIRQIDPFAYKFLDFLGTNTTDLPSIDIGAAYGIVSLEAHRRAHNIIANDLCPDHLQLMQQRAADEKLPPIPTLVGDFFGLPIQANSLHSIHISRVLHFLTGERIIEALNLFYTWLAPGGKLFAINETPFCGAITHYTHSS